MLVLVAMAIAGYGQRSVDALFRKYADNKGFITVTINGDLLRFINKGEKNDREHCPFPLDVTEVRILAQEHNDMHVENFYDLIMNDLDRSNYEEFMRITKSDQRLIMLVRAEGTQLREFLLVAGGDDNALIQIKGNLSFEDAKKISSDFKRNHYLSVMSGGD